MRSTQDGQITGKIDADLMTMLRNLNTKFDNFNETISSKISLIEKNYQDLNVKIDSIASKQASIDDAKDTVDDVR